jgi:hypothetical protein
MKAANDTAKSMLEKFLDRHSERSEVRSSIARHLNDESLFVRDDPVGSGSVAVALPGASSLRCVQGRGFSVALCAESDHAINIIVLSEQVERSTPFRCSVFERRIFH